MLDCLDKHIVGISKSAKRKTVTLYLENGLKLTMRIGETMKMAQVEVAQTGEFDPNDQTIFTNIFESSRTY